MEKLERAAQPGQRAPAQALPDPCWEHHLPPALMSRCQREQGPRGPGMSLGWGHRGALRSQRLLSCLLSPAWARRSVTVETPRALSQPVPARPPPTGDLEQVARPVPLRFLLCRPVSAAEAGVWAYLPRCIQTRPGVPTGATTLAKGLGAFYKVRCKCIPPPTGQPSSMPRHPRLEALKLKEGEL